MINQEANTKLTNENILTLSIQLVLQQYSFISSNIIISVVEIDSEYVLHECVLLSSKNASMCLSRQKPDNREEETVIKILALQFYLQLALWNSLRRGEERRGEERRGEVSSEKRGRKERTVRCWEFRLLQLQHAHPHCVPDTHTWTHKGIATKHMKKTYMHIQSEQWTFIHGRKLAAYSKVKSHEASTHVHLLQNIACIFTSMLKAWTHTHIHTHTHTQIHAHRHTHTQTDLSHREASYVSIFSHCGSVSLSACRPASCKMEGEKYAVSGRLRKTEDAALSFLFLRTIVVILISVGQLFHFGIWSCFVFFRQRVYVWLFAHKFGGCMGVRVCVHVEQCIS